MNLHKYQRSIYDKSIFLRYPKIEIRNKDNKGTCLTPKLNKNVAVVIRN